MYGLADSPRTVTRAFFGSRASASPSARFKPDRRHPQHHSGAAGVGVVAGAVVADDDDRGAVLGRPVGLLRDRHVIGAGHQSQRTA